MREEAGPHPDESGAIGSGGDADHERIAVAVADHPLLRLAAFSARFPALLGELRTPAPVLDWLRPDAATPWERDEALRLAVREMLRLGGHRPTGRGKPASEYLARAASEGGLGPINPAVDAGNAVSLHSGFPISVVDLDRTSPPLAVSIAPPGSGYVFNAAGQQIDTGGLVCLHDGAGPCANAVKDAQRTKTGPATRQVLAVIWGVRGFEDRLRETEVEFRRAIEACGAWTTGVRIGSAE